MTHSIAPRPVASSWSYRAYGTVPTERVDRPIRSRKRARVSIVRRASDTHRVVAYRNGTRKTVYSGTAIGAADVLLDAMTHATDTGRTATASATGRLVIRWDETTVVTLQALEW